MRLLLIEDDAQAAAFVCEGLRRDHHDITTAPDGDQGLTLACAGGWDLLIVDRLLPGTDGLELVAQLRAGGHQTPVLFLTALGGLDDRVAGLKAGGDDYVVKPFSLAELAARVEALGRRSRAVLPVTTLRVEDLEIDLLSRVVHRAGSLIDLQPREFKLLEYLARHAGQVVTRAMLLEDVWDFHFEPQTNLVESHVSRLRRKLDLGGPDLIHTVRHAGYRLGTAG